jgi:Glycosyl transferases group 1
MDHVKAKPKLVFFQYKYDDRLPEFLLMHKREHVKCLSSFFDVTVISEDCDYRQICDKYEPDLALFEAGVNHTTCRKLKIDNVRGSFEIPKIALHNADGFCDARAGFLSDLDHWGIDTYFAISITAAEHTPEVADRAFYWPVFADSDIYHDYGMWKSIPVLLTGNMDHFYPWRRKISRRISEIYPSLMCQHPGYGSGAGKKGYKMVGEDYARTINASRFVPACGTVAQEVVRKHFEIPGCNACLITEKSPGLVSAGFIDMVNCVFADDQDVLEKLDYLFKNPQELERITHAGYELVHSHHTLKHRDQIYQWFTLQRNLESDQKIIQTGPFQSPSVVQKESGYKTTHIISNGLHLKLLRQGDELLNKGKYQEAEQSYLKCASFMRWMPEPKLKLALCNLYMGNAKKALSRLSEPINFILYQYGAQDPDPVEWAYYIISLLCLGKQNAAVKHAVDFPWLRHPELDRVRLACQVIANNGIDVPMPKDDIGKRRHTMHQLPSRELGEWTKHLCIMLNASGQRSTAELLTRCLVLKDFRLDHASGDVQARGDVISNGYQSRNSAGTRIMRYFKKRMLIRKCRSFFRESVSDILHRLEARFGYFLPYSLSGSRNDEFYKVLRELMREGKIKSALIIGAARGRNTTEAFLAGAQENETNPSVYCIGNSKHRHDRLKSASTCETVTEWHEQSSLRPEKMTEELEMTIDKIKKDNRIESFDVILLDGSELENGFAGNGVLERELHAAGLILLDDVNTGFIYDKIDGLLRDPSYVLVATNPDLRNGYAIFRKGFKEGDLRQ